MPQIDWQKGEALRPITTTPSPWRWHVDPKGKYVRLESLSGHRLVVMTFRRWGMGGATPCFIDGHTRITDAVDFAVPHPGREHHEWNLKIDHPDARLIEHAPEMFELIVELVRENALQGDAKVRALKLMAGVCGLEAEVK